MKKYLMDRKMQKLFLPASFVCIIPLWFLLMTHRHIPTAIYGLGILAAVFFILDRFFKPWDNERAEARMKKAQQEREEEKTKIQGSAYTEESTDAVSD